MPSPRSHSSSTAQGASRPPPAAFDDVTGTAPLSDAELCERAVRAIWRSVEHHDLLDEKARDELAALLESLAALDLGELPQRLIHTLRMPNPLDAAQLYWLTRRLLTLIPELQAAAAARAP